MARDLTWMSRLIFQRAAPAAQRISSVITQNCHGSISMRWAGEEDGRGRACAKAEIRLMI
jgi:hypothetical protein